jgi:hypothetical protein
MQRNEEMHNLHSTPDRLLLRPERVRWAGLLAGMVIINSHTNVCVKTLTGETFCERGNGPSDYIQGVEHFDCQFLEKAA